MLAARFRVRTLSVSLAAGLIAGPPAFAQGQPDPPTARDLCIKVAPGKAAEYEKFLQDAVVPVVRARAEAGEFAWFVALRAVAPAGTSAPCDYRLVYGHKGLPPEPPSRESLVAALGRAKLTLTADAYIARRNALSHLVSTDYWVGRDRLGPNSDKGSYVRINRYKVKYGQMGEWLRLEATYWKALMDAWLKTGGKGTWVVNQLWMPGGDSVPYNAETVDIFPDWNSLLQGVPVGELWPKVHAGTTTTEAFDRLQNIRSVHDVTVYKLTEVVRVP